MSRSTSQELKQKPVVPTPRPIYTHVDERQKTHMCNSIHFASSLLRMLCQSSVDPLMGGSNFSFACGGLLGSARMERKGEINLEPHGFNSAECSHLFLQAWRKKWPKGSIHMEAGVLAQHGTLGTAKLVQASACTSIHMMSRVYVCKCVYVARVCAYVYVFRRGAPAQGHQI